MVLYLGDRDFYQFIAQTGAELSEDTGADGIEKIIVSENSENSIAAVKFAIDNGISLLGVLDGYQSVVAAFGGECVPVDCAEGKQEWAVLDTCVPLFSGIESVTKICRGSPDTVSEVDMPTELDCAARAETGEIIAVRAQVSGAEIYGVNFYLNSSLTPDGLKIIKNFLEI